MRRMNPKRILVLLLILALVFSCASCGKKQQQTEPAVQETDPREDIGDKTEDEVVTGDKTENEIVTEPPEPLITDAEIAELSTERITWGPGRNFDDEDRPVSCVNLEKTYDSLGADFIFLDEASKGKVYFTFDEGYENGYTPAILDVLKEKGVSAVFFVTLPYARSCPDLIQRMIDEGHVVGNHTDKHPDMTEITLEDAEGNVQRLHDYIYENYGYTMTLFRFPTGGFSEQTLGLLEKLGYRSVFWSFAYADWDPAKQWEHRKAFDYVTDHVHDGEIFLLHAVSETNTAILGDVIDNLRERGYEIAPYPVNQ